MGGDDRLCSKIIRKMQYIILPIHFHYAQLVTNIEHNLKNNYDFNLDFVRFSGNGTVTRFIKMYYEKS